MTDFDLKELLRAAEEAARAAGLALKARGEGFSGVDAEIGRDIKLKADKAAEAIILARLKDAGDIPVLAEESGFSGGEGEVRWIVDPLDGSANYNRGMPLCAVSVALARGTEPLLGVIYDFSYDEMLSGGPALGAALNGAPLSVSDIADPAKGVLVTGLAIDADYSRDALADFAEEFARWKKVRMLGTSTLAAAYVAAGKADRYAEGGAFFWDVAAGAALVLAAGGRVILGDAPLDQRRSIFMDNGRLPI